MATKKATEIPTGEDGYTVTTSTGTVHTRYAAHAGESAQRTRTIEGVRNILAGAEPVLCRICFGDPADEAKSEGGE
jgi:hypothetical protein